MANLSARSILSHPPTLLAFGFGSGLAPVVPGTFGTAAAVPFWWLLQLLPLPLYGAAVALAFVAGIALCGSAARRLGVHDHGGIVWDEFVGLWITLAAVPAEWPWILAGFLLFRLFDIWKPWPIRRLDTSVGGGFGIMVDDAVAGLYAAICLQAALRLA